MNIFLGEHPSVALSRARARALSLSLSLSMPLFLSPPLALFPSFPPKSLSSAPSLQTPLFSAGPDGGDSMAITPPPPRSRQRSTGGDADAELPPAAQPDSLEAPATPITWYESPSSPADPSSFSSFASEDRPIRVYADGIYDLFHFGHARALEQAKKSFPNTYLLVGCCSDEITHRYKGKTVMTDVERYESLRHCKWVDEVIPDAPWVITQEFIDKHNIDYVAHDSLPYADASGAGKDVYEFVKAIGKFKETKRTDGISTSDIIMRIVKDYNEYVMRNLARGYTRKDLGVSYVKEKQLRMNMGITKLREKVKEHQEKLHTVAKTAGMHHSEWVENADRWVAGFLEKFEEGCHIMETAIKDRIQEGLKRQSSKEKNSFLQEPTASRDSLSLN